MARTPENTVATYIEDGDSLSRLRDKAAGCTACDLYKHATHVVFGEGRKGAKVMFVGEQPGDKEDREGRPFVGPAGKLLDRALEDARIDRKQTYVTNVVKHFKYVERGKRRLHQKPKMKEISACRPWLEAEIERVGPEVIVCLGATAAKALYGNDFRITRQRGQPVGSPLARRAFATVHPSSLLRAPDEEARRRGYEDFVRDLKDAVRGITDVRTHGGSGA